MTLSAQPDSTSSLEPEINLDVMHTREPWKVLAYRVPTKAKPADIGWYTVPGYRCVKRERRRFRRPQVYAIDVAMAENDLAPAKRTSYSALRRYRRSSEDGAFTEEDLHVRVQA